MCALPVYSFSDDRHSTPTRELSLTQTPWTSDLRVGRLDPLSLQTTLRSARHLKTVSLEQILSTAVSVEQILSTTVSVEQILSTTVFVVDSASRD